MRQPIIGVMEPGAAATTIEIHTACELERSIAATGWILLTGGRPVGVMEAANQGAQSAGGLTVGILPHGDRTAVFSAVNIAILTEMGNARNVINVLSSAVVIAGGMGVGAASEVALALKSGKFVVLLRGNPESQQFFHPVGGSQGQVAHQVESAIAIVRQPLSQR